MQHAQLVTEERLHSNSSLFEARVLIPELLFRLIYASIQNPTYLRLPVAGSVGQIGWDGVLISAIEFSPYIPEGKSFWEIGTSGDPQGKATDDFKKRTERTDPAERAMSTFLFVTPLSAYHSWPAPDQEAWIRKRKSDENWKDIRIIDGTKLVQWLYLFPGIDLWLAQKFGIMPTTGLTTAPLHWKELQVYGDPPPLKPDVFLQGRTEALNGVLKVFEGQTNELRLETKFPVEGIDFVSAALESLEEEKRLTYSGRCVIISDPETWRAMCYLQTPHVLVAAAPLDLERTHS